MSKFFTISIGNKGSIISLRNKHKVFEMFEFKSINENEETRRVVDNLFKKNKKLFVYIILDNIGQNYSRKKIPAVGFIDAIKIINRKFNYEIPKLDLKDKRLLGRNKNTGEWEVMFISSPIDGYLQEWLDYIDQTDSNILDGIYMLPLEFETILKNINKKLKVSSVKNGDLNMIILENSVSGCREITFVDKKLAFTRILQEDYLDNGDNFSKYFREDTLQTIEYLKRFYPNFSQDNLTIHTITNSEKKAIIRDYLSDEEKRTLKIRSFSFGEFAGLLGYDKKKYERDRFGDLLFQDLILNKKKIISFSTKDMKQLVFISRINNILSKLIFVCFLILIATFLTCVVNISKNTYKIINVTKNLESAKKELAEKESQNFGGKSLRDIDEIIDFTLFYSKAKNYFVNPFDFLTKFSSFINNNFLSTNVKWRINNFNKEELLDGKSTYSFDITLFNESGKIDGLFKKYEDFDRLMKMNFNNYNISISELPKNINFDINYFSFPLQVEFVEK